MTNATYDQSFAVLFFVFLILVLAVLRLHLWYSRREKLYGRRPYEGAKKLFVRFWKWAGGDADMWLFPFTRAVSAVLLLVTAVPFALIWLGTAGMVNCWDWPPRLKKPVAFIPSVTCFVGMLLGSLGLQDYCLWFFLLALFGFLFFFYPPPYT